ncbi:MAG: hypothetical protein ABJ084_06485 [Halioglobus sp.]
MKSLTSTIMGYVLIALLASASQTSFAVFGTTVPISAELATNIANSVFPQTVPLRENSLYVSNPVVLYTSPDANKASGQASPRLRLQLNIQSLRRQADNTLKANAPGQAEVSGELGFDPITRQILLINPSIDSLQLGPGDLDGQALREELDRQWAEQVTNPMRIELPAHPYLIPFRQGIKDIRLDEQQGIVVEVLFE